MSSFKTKSFYDTELYYYYLLHKIVCADKVIETYPQLILHYTQ